MATTSDVLRSVPLFSGMTDRSIDTIAQLANETRVPAGTVLAREGEAGSSFVVIRAGAAAVEQAGAALRRLGPGDYFGEIALIDGGVRTATVTAIDPIDAVVVERDGFERLMRDFPAIRIELLGALTQRLRQRAPQPLD
jgi:CRP/FNR family cyclic AMP-dependent transcriptional regulator